jgi:hypothetical protein
MTRALSCSLLALPLCVVIACDPGDGAPTVRISDEPPGIDCPTGGSRVDTTVDDATTTLYACNGADGSRTIVTVVPAGDRCAAGGVRIDSSSGASYVCTGGPSIAATEITITPEPPGAHCPAGGLRLDADGEPSYVCNGIADVAVTVEPPGEHCPAGGYALATGTEVHYLCHGIDGTSDDCADGDRDGFWTGCRSYTAARPGPDCDDRDDTRFHALTAFADQDLDGVSAGPARTLCGDVLPIGYLATASASQDCDDADPAAASDCSTCIDADGDGAYIGCTSYAQRRGPDCNDGDVLVWPGMAELPADGKDNDCAGDGDLRPLNGTGIFVSPSGSDSAAGTRTAPKRTLAAALTAAGPGGRVYAAGGNYTASGDPPLRPSASIFGGFQPGNWDVRNPGTYVTRIGVAVQPEVDRSVVIDGLSIETTGSYYIPVLAQSTQLVLSRCYVTGIKTVTQVDGGTLIAVANTITQVTSSSEPFVAIDSIVGGRLTAIGNTVLAPGSALATTATGISVRGRSRARVANNFVDVSAGGSTGTHTGILVAGLSAAEIERNQVSVEAATSVGLQSTDGNFLVIRGNTFRNGDERFTTSHGLLLGPDVALVVGNVFIARGTRHYVAVAIEGASSDFGHLELVGNVIAPPVTRTAVGVLIGSYAQLTAVNNVIELASPGHAVQISGGEVELYHNDLVAPQGCLLAGLRYDGDCSLDAADVNRVGAGNVSVPPGFVDAANGDYHLRADSPIIGRGYDVVNGHHGGEIDRSSGPLSISLRAASLAARDVDGQSRTGRWDIGLDEVQ